MDTQKAPRCFRRWLALISLLCLLGAAGCGAVIDSMLGNPDRCRQNCEDTYRACLEQIGTADGEHYCLVRRNQCVADC